MVEELKPNLQKSRAYWKVLVVVLIPTVGWLLNLGWREYKQVRAEMRSLQKCESEYLGAIDGPVRRESQRLKRSLTLKELKELRESAEQSRAICPESRLPYQWSDETQDLTSVGIAAWDPQPNEAPDPFRNVVGTDGRRRHVFESEFAKTLSAARKPK